MREGLEKYFYTYNNVDGFNLYQTDVVVPVDTLEQGTWKMCAICSKKSVSGIYFYNTDYVSQVYSDTIMKIKKGGFKVILNGDNELKEQITSINDRLEIYKNGFSFKKGATLFLSTFHNSVCGLMIVLNRT